MHLGMRSQKKARHPDKATLCEEKLDDFVAVCSYHEDMRLGKHPKFIGRSCADAIDELKQTKTKYITEYFQKHGKDTERRVG